MGATAAGLLESLEGIPSLPAPPADLVPVVNDLYARNAEVATLDDLASFGLGRSPEQIARALRDRGWLYPLSVNGAWGVSTGFPAPQMGWFVSLRARLMVEPATPACIGGKSVAQVRGWLRRPTAPAIGFAGRGRPPRCLAEYSALRWQPRIPLDTVHGLPLWKPETLVAFMGARPSLFPWTDIAEWLWELCEAIDPELVAAELGGRPAAAWARTAYLLDRGENPRAATALTARGPRPGGGPHYFGRRIPAFDDRFPHLPRWSPAFNVVDFLMERNWEYGREL